MKAHMFSEENLCAFLSTRVRVSKHANLDYECITSYIYAYLSVVRSKMF